LTTQHGGQLETRPMAPYVDRAAGVVRFITKLDSSKTGDIGSSGQVNIGYSHPDKNTYVSVSGTGTVGQDRAKLKELWNPWAEAWLPQGPDGADVALITVEPDTAVIWDSTSSKIVSAFEHLRAAITGGRPNVGTMDKVSL
jgi:general stress protein 26